MIGHLYNSYAILKNFVLFKIKIKLIIFCGKNNLHKYKKIGYFISHLKFLRM